MAAGISASALGHAQKILPLQDYIMEVREGNRGLKANQELKESSLTQSREAELITRPSLFAEATLRDDKKETSSVAVQGNQTQVKAYKLGLEQNFNFGLKGKVYYAATHTDVQGTLPAFLPKPKYWETAPTAELSLSLLRNGLGSETRAQQEAASSKALANSYLESFKAKITVTEAEVTYWKLSLARENVRSQKEIFEKALKLKEWNARRISLELADKVDLLQADANLNLRQLEYENALYEEKAASEAFNLARGVASEKVSEQLEALRPEIIAALKAPPRGELRDDVKASLETSRATKAASRIGVEKNYMNLELFGTYAMNKKGDTLNEASGDVANNDHPTSTIGLRFSTPLDFGLIAKTRAAYRIDERAAENNYQRKVLEQEVDWQQSLRKLDEAKRRFSQVRQIEDIQERKLSNERSRLSKGRSTTFQVLQFEQDYINAQLNRIRISAEVLGLYAKLKTFGETL